MTAVAAPEHTLASALLAATGTLRRHVRRAAGRPAELAELTAAQLELARLVATRPGLSVAAAAAELGLAPNTVSTLVRQLVGAGVLERRPDEADRRVARLTLTPALAEVIAVSCDRRALALARAIERLPVADRRRLGGVVSLLERLAAEVDA